MAAVAYANLVEPAGVSHTRLLPTYQYAPLSSLYFSPGLNKMLPLHPSCIIEEIESYYCPQCLENFPSSEAASYKNRCPRLDCFMCPCCSANLATVLSIVEGHSDTQAYLSCGYCHWDSIGRGLCAASGTALLTLMMDIERDQQAHFIVAGSVARYGERFAHKAQKESLEMRLGQHGGTSMRTNILMQLAKLEYGASKDSFTYNSWEDTEKMVRSKEEAKNQMLRTWNANMDEVVQELAAEGKEILARQRGSSQKNNRSEMEKGTSSGYSLSTSPGSASVALNRMMCPPSEDLYNGIQDIPPTTLHEQLLHVQVPISSTSDLIPVRRPLLVKRSVRCKTTFENGSPGILLKPHVNPLMGDTSMRANAGNWFKKSSLARSFVPRISVNSCHFSSPAHVVLTITNPIDEHISVHVTQGTDHDRGTHVFELPEKPFMIRAFDELADEDANWADEGDGDDGECSFDVSNDPPEIVSRKMNRVVLKLNLAPSGEEVNRGEQQEPVLFFQVHVEVNKKPFFAYAVKISFDGNSSLGFGGVVDARTEEEFPAESY